MDDTIISDNVARSGAGVYLRTGSFLSNDNYYAANIASALGGALYVPFSVQVEDYGSIHEYNHADRGGVVYSRGSYYGEYCGMWDNTATEGALFYVPTDGSAFFFDDDIGLGTAHTAFVSALDTTYILAPGENSISCTDAGCFCTLGPC